MRGGVSIDKNHLPEWSKQNPGCYLNVSVGDDPKKKIHPFLGSSIKGKNYLDVKSMAHIPSGVQTHELRFDSECDYDKDKYIHRYM